MSQSNQSSFELAFVKLVGTGNDFIFIDARTALPFGFSSLDRREFVRRMCHRHFGIGADGVVFVESSPIESRLKWDFYNSDGSSAEMCGNATRCMGRWAEQLLNRNEIEFETVAGLVRASTQGSMIASELPFVSADLRKIEFDLEGRREKAYLVNTGVPHAVFEISRLSEASRYQDVIQALRFHPESGPRGANVTFLERASGSSYKTVTYERGVEGFTLSCGTGVLAAAAVGLSAHPSSSGVLQAEVETPGGELTVRFKDGFRGVTLIGPATVVFSGQITTEFLK